MKPYYQTDLGKLYHGDCLEVMKFLLDVSVDLVLADSPYGIDYQCARRIKSERFPKIANDIDTSYLPEVSKELFRISAEHSHAYFFCRWDTWPYPCKPFKQTNMIVWDKLQHGTGDLVNSFGPQHELIAFATKGRRGFNGNRPVDIIKHKKVASSSLLHPCQKPVGLISRFIELSSKEGECILDPFLGSGTTAIACERLGRRWIGIEISEEYCQMAKDRIEMEARQGRLF